MAAEGLHEHGLGAGLLAENPQLIHQNLAGLLAGYRVGIGCHYLKAIFGGAVGDRPNVVLDVEHRG
ncbi:hypothetical protein D3C80_1538340 [compost metagenome]